MLFFLLQASVAVKCINPQPYNGLFELSLPIFEGDSKAKVVARLMKTDRSKMKGRIGVFSRFDFYMSSLVQIGLHINIEVSFSFWRTCHLLLIRPGNTVMASLSLQRTWHSYQSLPEKYMYKKDVILLHFLCQITDCSSAHSRLGLFCYLIRGLVRRFNLC